MNKIAFVPSLCFAAVVQVAMLTDSFWSGIAIYCVLVFACGVMSQIEVLKTVALGLALGFTAGGVGFVLAPLYLYVRPEVPMMTLLVVGITLFIHLQLQKNGTSAPIRVVYCILPIVFGALYSVGLYPQLLGLLLIGAGVILLLDNFVFKKSSV